jgi:hypothetical protein
MDLAVKSGRIKIRLALELLISGLAEQEPVGVFERRNESTNEH